jgi:hypothetical protein
MTEKQLQTIIALLSGTQFAIVHLSNILSQQHGISSEDIAASFEQTGENIPPTIANRELVQIVFRQIATGIRGSSSGPEYEALLSRLLH